MWRLPPHFRHYADIVDERSANTVFDMLLLAPFTHLSRNASQIAWMLCKPLLIVLIVACVLRIVRNAGGQIDALPLLLLFVAWAWPVIGDIQEGQTNLLMLAPLCAGLLLAQREESARATWAAGATSPSGSSAPMDANTCS